MGVLTGLFGGVGSIVAVPTLAAGDDELKMMVLGGGLILVAVLAVLRTVRKVSDTKEREQTRREIAAYVAEGSITPDDAARLLNSGLNETVAAELARGVTWGTISAAKAQKVAQAFQQPAGVPPPMPPR